MGVHIELYQDAIAGLEDAVKRSARAAMDVFHQDVVSSAVMPYDTGDMQNNAISIKTSEDGDKLKISLTTNAPQARRLYYHPEYNFQTVNNANARGEWLEEYITGAKADFLQEAFAQLMRKELDT